MKVFERDGITLYDAAPRAAELREAAIEGLQKSQPTLPCKFFYDERGSQLFDAICESEDYYVTRTEQGIMGQFVEEMAEALGAGCRLVEPGSGSSMKTRPLLAALPRPTTYIPIDISADYLFDVAVDLNREFPDLVVTPVAADYTEDIDLPPAPAATPNTAAYFPGSTLGNFAADEALAFLKRLRRLVGANGKLLIGTDRVKDREVMHLAYNDRQGITADFNRNVLQRLAAEPNVSVDPDGFRHEAVWQEEPQRIEMRLVAEGDQEITVAGHSFRIPAGGHIVTEHSHKYTEETFQALAERAGFAIQQVWTDSDRWFAVNLLG